MPKPVRKPSKRIPTIRHQNKAKIWDSKLADGSANTLVPSLGYHQVMDHLRNLEDSLRSALQCVQSLQAAVGSKGIQPADDIPF